MFIRQIEYLVALAELGHFSRAAEACHVSQPALSSAIAKLERELGLNLVRRGRQYDGLTEEGRRVVGWARHMLASYRAMRQEGGRVARRWRGRCASAPSPPRCRSCRFSPPVRAPRIRASP
jgi:DNA-binding transcriptional LysR family regulator